MCAERKLRLCQSPRAALSEMKCFSGMQKALVSIGDIDVLIKMMEGRTATEDEVAEFIIARFRDQAFTASAPGVDIAKIQEEVRPFREALLSERRRLIREESELYSKV